MIDSIGLFLRSGDNAFQNRLAEAGSQAAKRRGFALWIESIQHDASDQIDRIRKAIANAASNRLVAILVSGVRGRELIPVAQEAAQAGLGWAELNDGACVDEVRGQYPDRAVFAATCDQAAIGRLQSEQVRALLGKGGKILCVTGDLDSAVARLRLDGLKQGLGGDFDMVELNADWTSEGARRTVESWSHGIASKKECPRVFVAQNDEMALGIRQALRDLDCRRNWRLADAPILGCGGAEKFGQRLVREGRLRATVIIPAASDAAIDWIARSRKSGEVPPARVLLPALSFPALSRIKR